MSTSESTSWHDNIQSLQVDMTSYCNAKCGGCARNRNGHDITPGVVLEHFNLDIWNRLAIEDTKGIHIKELVINGNWGDGMMHPYLADMIATFAEYHPETSLYLHTNGSMRSAKFWKQLATTCRQFSNHMVVFSLDGLEDTHSIYRRNTDFGKVVQNIKSFTEERGRANVTMTLFEHNKHQVAEVRALAKSLDASVFTLRHSFGDNLQIIAPGENYMIHACNEIPEERSELHNKHRLSDIKNHMEHLDFADTIPEVETECPWLADRMVQIDPWGTVWPCCHISYHGTDVILEHTGEEATDENFVEARQMNNLKHTPLYTILSNRWYADVLPDAVAGEKWVVCQEQCFTD